MRAVALGEDWSREGGLLLRRSLSTRRSFTRRPVGEGGNGLTSQRLNAFTLPKQRERASAFTLLELLIVVGIMGLLLVLIAPAFTTIKGGTDVTSAAYTIQGVLDTARTYAKANNTYTWVGFYEEDATATTPTNNTPAYPGKGRVLLAIVASKDGTKIYEDADPAAALPLDRISPVGKLVRIEGIHLTDLGNPSPTPNPAPVPDTIPARPYTPYTEGSPFDHFNRISSDSIDTTRFTFTAQNYTFYKTIRFNPRGDANINSTYNLKHEGEIGIKPTHGAAVDLNSPNVVAIQFTGFGGNIKIYRQ
jgi:type II secretory pathway pseudopilin PulG